MKKLFLILCFLLIIEKNNFSKTTKQILPQKTEKKKLSNEIVNYLKDFGVDAHINSDEVYDDQRASYATGGGIILRNRVKTVSPVNIQLPHINAGCGGIDIYAGGLSFIQGSELINTLKSIGVNAATYAFMLSLETMSPQIANTIKQLQGWANEINAIGINSCEAGQMLVNSLWFRSDKASEIICGQMSGKEGRLSDYIQARHKCNQQDHKLKALQEAEDKKVSIFGSDYNIAWEVIKKNPSIDMKSEIPELLMSLTGTIIISHSGKIEAINLKDSPKNQTQSHNSKKIHFQTKSAKIIDEKFLSALFRGGKVSMYFCKDKNSDSKCLNVIEEMHNIKEESSWLSQIKKNIYAIKDHLIDDIPLNQDLKKFLQSTELPILRLLVASIAYKHGQGPLAIDTWAEFIAMDYLLNYITNLVEESKAIAKHLKTIEGDSSSIEEYIKNLDDVLIKIKEYDLKTQKRRNKEMQVLQRLEWIEEQLKKDL